MPAGENHSIRWPWSPRHWKPKDRIRNLVRAGALIAAEIDRLQRAEVEAPADTPEEGRQWQGGIMIVCPRCDTEVDVENGPYCVRCGHDWRQPAEVQS